jgi:hypothetical protein
MLVFLYACKNKLRVEEKTADIAEGRKVIVDTVKHQVDTIFLSQTDTAFLVKNKPVQDDIGDMQKEYIVHIYFSQKNWPALTYKNAIGAELYLTRDLDADQQPELLLRPEWFSSCWSSLNLYSLKNNAWKLIKSGSMYFCSTQYPLAKRVIKTDNGYGLLTDSLAEDKFITLKKEIKF